MFKNGKSVVRRYQYYGKGLPRTPVYQESVANLFHNIQKDLNIESKLQLQDVAIYIITWKRELHICQITGAR